jgi:chorismate synthase
LLATQGVEVIGVTHSIAGIGADLESHDWSTSRDHEIRCPDVAAAERMADAIQAALEDGDSVGGVIEVRATGVPIGLGEPVFDKLDARLGAALLSIGAVKGVEVGDGFALARMRGAEANDALEPPDRFASNRAGGILGGISNGEPIIVRAAVKPTPSIATAQKTVARDGAAREVSVGGRHDPCIVPRIVAVAEAMVCLVLADVLLIHRARELVQH